MLKGRTNFVGILGWPLDHTLSPALHNAAFRSMGIDWTYLSFPVPPEELPAAVAGLRALGARGANVTMPHKEAVVELMDSLSIDAESVGAVNTIEINGGKLVGHNTDVQGFREFLSEDAGVTVAGRSALVLGAGGAARAIVKALGDLSAASIAVAARQPVRAEPLTKLASSVSVIEWGDAPDASATSDVIVNCTPLGMDGDTPLDVDFRPGQVVVDLIYRPPRTPFLIKAQGDGADTWGGLGMLVHQAAGSFDIWTGRPPPIEVMSAAAIHALGAGVLQKDE